ncbi:triose-phosphate isomerase [Marinobacterium rhizophilum]|uniref:triose-phosphate isomerase n=1 Tax=Marinobacterium rhizophilum TaxID=420402 RepID=UPI00037AEE8E|nr:triose-phosphate isomerase [Marinobacterium rhizophilum]
MIQNLVIGNWKMNGSFAANEQLLDALLPALAGLETVGIALCPPFPYLSQADWRLKDSGIALGAQNLNEHEAGAHTGEVSAAMLKDLGCRYVLVGHSERRSLYGETDADTAAKFSAARAAGVVPVLCVGETLAERERDETTAVVYRQLDAIRSRLGARAFAGSVVAYEPVWAIGTGLSATPEQAQVVHAAIRQYLCECDTITGPDIALLYGGSVKADNAAALLAQPDINGALVGGAALDADAFAAICRAANG